jgi:hypothetical protein
MGLPKFEAQGSLFESLGSIAPQLFDHHDRYKLFALKIWPLLSGCREELAQCYDQGNGRPGVEPVVLLGVSIFQFLTNLPEAYRIEAFTIDIAGRQAICPGGFKNTQCSRLEESATHRVTYRFEWSTHQAMAEARRGQQGPKRVIFPGRSPPEGL